MTAVKAGPVYAVVSVPEGFSVHRNGASLKTPAGEVFALPTSALAEAIAAEWRAQGSKPNPASMPLNQLAATTLDITRKQRKAIIEQLAGYGAADLLCHRAEHPQDLVIQQQELWQPMLDWCATRFGAQLRAGEGIMPVVQSPETINALRRAVEVHDDFSLTGLKQAAEISGSLVLALALTERHLTAEQVFVAAECDALFQMQKWGKDAEAVKRHEGIRRDLDVCEKWFELMDGKIS